LCMFTIIVAATSISLGLILKEVGSLAAVVTGVNLPLTLLSGILLPLSLAPTWMLVVAHFNHMYYVVEASRVLSSGTILSWTVARAFLVIIAFVIIVLWWATRVFRKAVA